MMMIVIKLHATGFTRGPFKYIPGNVYTFSMPVFDIIMPVFIFLSLGLLFL